MSEKDFNTVFSQCLKFYMEKYNMSQAELAKRLGVGPTSVYNWYNGIKTPRMDKVDAMCKIFNCKRSDLMLEHRLTPDYSSTSTPEEFATIIKPYRELDGAGQEAVKHTLSRETARLEAITQLREQLIKESARPSIVRDPNADYLIPDAAHERNGKYTDEDRLDDETMLD